MPSWYLAGYERRSHPHPAPSPPPSVTPFTWQDFTVGGGGLVTQIYGHPDGTLLARADVYGVYLLNRSATPSPKWVQTNLSTNMPANLFGFNYNFGDGAYDCCIDPSNSTKLWMFFSGRLVKGTRTGTSVSWSLTNWDSGPPTFPNSSAPNPLGNTLYQRLFGNKMNVDPNNSNVIIVNDELSQLTGVSGFPQGQGSWISTNGGSTWSVVSAAAPAGWNAGVITAITPTYNVFSNFLGNCAIVFDPTSSTSSPGGILQTDIAYISQMSSTSLSSWTGTSSSSVTIAGSGSLTWASVTNTLSTVQVGMPIKMDAGGGNTVKGIVTVVSGASVTVNVGLATGSGTFSSWTGSMVGGVFKRSTAAGAFTLMDGSPANPQDMRMAPDGTLWICTADGSIYRFLKGGSTWDLITPTDQQGGTLSNWQYVCVDASNKDHILVSSGNGTLETYNATTATPSSITWVGQINLAPTNICNDVPWVGTFPTSPQRPNAYIIDPSNSNVAWGVAAQAIFNTTLPLVGIWNGGYAPTITSPTAGTTITLNGCTTSSGVPTIGMSLFLENGGQFYANITGVVSHGGGVYDVTIFITQIAVAGNLPGAVIFPAGFGHNGTNGIIWSSVILGWEELVTMRICVPPGGDPLLTSWDVAIAKKSLANRSSSLPVYQWDVEAGHFVTQSTDTDYASSDSSFIVTCTGQSDTGGSHDASSTNYGAIFTVLPSQVSSVGGSVGGNVAVATHLNFVRLPAFTAGIYYTTDGANTWTSVATINGIATNLLWGGQSQAFYTKLLTVDKGGTNGMGNYTYYLWMGSLGGSFGVNGSKNGCYISQDQGATWTLQANSNVNIQDGVSGSPNITSAAAMLKAVPGQQGHLFFASGATGAGEGVGAGPYPHPDHHLWRSTDGGATFTDVSNGSFKIAEPWDIAYGKPKPGGGGYPSVMFFGGISTNGGSTYTMGFWQSDDNCATWFQIGNEFPSRSVADPNYCWNDFLTCIAGDPNNYGVWYAGYNGSGYIVYAPGPPPSPPTFGAGFNGTLNLINAGGPQTIPTIGNPAGDVLIGIYHLHAPEDGIGFDTITLGGVTCHPIAVCQGIHATQSSVRGFSVYYAQGVAANQNLVLNITRTWTPIGSNTSLFFETGTNFESLCVSGIGVNGALWSTAQLLGSNTAFDDSPYLDQTVTITSGTYNNSTGVATVTMSSLPTTASFGFYLKNLTGTGGFAGLNGAWLTTSSNGVDTFTFQAPVGLGATTITGGTLTQTFFPSAPSDPQTLNATIPANGVGIGFLWGLLGADPNPTTWTAPFSSVPAAEAYVNGTQQGPTASTLGICTTTGPVTAKAASNPFSWAGKQGMVVITVAGSGSSPATNTITLGASANPSACGSSVTFTATVAGNAGTPTGTVTFVDQIQNGARPLDTVTLSGGVATYTTSNLTAGSHIIEALYIGDGVYSSSYASGVNYALLTQTVNPGASTPTVSLTGAPNSAPAGTTVTFTATVSGAGATPNGTVDFSEPAVPPGAPGPVFGFSVRLANGVATATNAFSTGSHTLKATYNGDVNYNSGSNTFVLTVT